MSEIKILKSINILRLEQDINSLLKKGYEMYGTVFGLDEWEWVQGKRIQVTHWNSSMNMTRIIFPEKKNVLHCLSIG